MNDIDAAEERRKHVESWNKTMINMWQESIHKLGVIDTGRLYRSPIVVRLDHDGRWMSLDIGFEFLEYGIWQHFGKGGEYSLDNGGDLEFLDKDYRREHGLNKPRKRGPKWGGGSTSGRVRKARPWFAKSFYKSVAHLKGFMASSVGREFVGLFADIDASDYRKSALYQRAAGHRL